MRLAGIQLGRLSGSEVERLLRSAQQATLTYDHQGSTLDPQRWGGTRVRRHQVVVGQGAADFDAARAALRSWVAQGGVSARVEPPKQPVVVGASILVIIGIPLASVVAPNRIVVVIDEPRRFAFAYGTLPGHPARGEESFSVEHRDDGSVQAWIRVQAEPATLLARAGAPIVRAIQAVALRRYVAALATHVEGARRRPSDGDPG